MTVNEKRRLQSLLNRAELRKALVKEADQRLHKTEKSAVPLKKVEERMRNA